jgi:predicted RNA-binding protein
MCLARVRYVEEGEERARGAIEDVARIDITPEGLKVTNLVGSVIWLAGDIQSIDFMDSLVVVEKE